MSASQVEPSQTQVSWSSVFTTAIRLLTFRATREDLIVVTLTILNLERAVFEFMGGVRVGTASDESYAMLFLLSFLSVLLFGPILACYVALVAWPHVAARQARLKEPYDQ